VVEYVSQTNDATRINPALSPDDATIEITYKIKDAKDAVVGSTEVTNQAEEDVNTEYLEAPVTQLHLTVFVTSVEIY
jgi:hypothetical protein